MANKEMDFIVTSLSDEHYSTYICEKIQDIANEAISSRGIFIIGVSGGSVVNFLCEGLGNIKTDWKCWRIILCDERIVDEKDPESTYGLYKNKLFPKIPDFNIDNFINADTSLLGPRCAQDYEEKLRNLWQIKSTDAGYGMADLLILGVGPDGHTASLFPGHRILEEKSCWVTSIDDSPKPPPNRITLTYQFINKSSHILVAGKGKEKWDILQKIKSGEDLPIGRVSNPGGHLEWILNSQ